MKKAFAYIDGFNLYYRAVKGTPYKWLNLRQMCELLVPEYDITRIKYFTAPVSGKDDPEKPARQQTYLRALRTISVEVVMGKFLTREVPMRLVGDKNQIVMVLKTEEKGSDVNLAAHLLIDGFTKQYEAAIVLSNDSDLTMPIQYVRDNLGWKLWSSTPIETSRVNRLPMLAPRFANCAKVFWRRANFLIRFITLTRTSRNQKGKVAQGMACQKQEKRGKREAFPMATFPHDDYSTVNRNLHLEFSAYCG